MRAVQFSDSIPRYALGKVVGKARPGVYWGKTACTQLRDVTPPSLPGPEWVRVRTLLGGICGSDLGTITLHASTSTSVFTSFPFTLGHENVGVVSERGTGALDVPERQRVVVNPLLPCATRGIAVPCPACARGDENRCTAFDLGALAPGMLTGFCRDTGGSWSAEFVAHRTQLLPVADTLSDEAAVLAEPFGVAIHAVLRAWPQDGQDVLVIGGGIIGLSVIAALRALGSQARIVASVRYPFQAQAARDLGADVVISPQQGKVETQLREAFNARALKPVLGPDVVVGGAAVVFECVGSSGSVAQALQYAAAGGVVLLVGLAGQPSGVDWTPIWLKELDLRGTFCYATETWNGQRINSMALALDLMTLGVVSLDHLVTHRFALDDYAHALDTVTSKGGSSVIKAVFDFRDTATDATIGS